MNKARLAGLLATTLLLGACNEQTARLDTEQQKYSYAIGIQVGNNLKRQDVDLDGPALAQAIKDVLAGTPSRLDEKAIQAAMMSIHKAQLDKRQAAGKSNQEEAEKFLAENQKREGVKVLASGVQYKEIEAGKGKSPTAKDTVKVHYRGTLINGTEFDSSYKRNQPVTFNVGQVIKGWQEVLQLMKPGAKWHVAIPPQLAYGERGAPPNIGPNSLLVFEIKLLEIVKK